MTDADLDEIRAALAAATDETYPSFGIDRLVANAPTWLATLCDEIERLRTALVGDIDEFVILAPEDFKTLVAERDAALAECERLRTMLEQATGGAENYYDQAEAWRACADQLAHVIAEYVDFSDMEPDEREVLAAYERLKAGQP